MEASVSLVAPVTIIVRTSVRQVILARVFGRLGTLATALADQAG
jgi:hypothetical protein